MAYPKGPNTLGFYIWSNLINAQMSMDITKDRSFRDVIGTESAITRYQFGYLEKAIKGAGKHLDIGCGAGTFIGFLSSVEASLGIDVEPLVISHAAKIYGCPQKNFQVIGNGPLPFPDGVFDCVTIIDQLNPGEFDRSNTILSESGRVLQPGGKIVLSMVRGEATMPEVTALKTILSAHGFRDMTANGYLLLPHLARPLGAKAIHIAGALELSLIAGRHGTRVLMTAIKAR